MVENNMSEEFGGSSVYDSNELAKEFGYSNQAEDTSQDFGQAYNSEDLAQEFGYADGGEVTPQPQEPGMIQKGYEGVMNFFLGSAEDQMAEIDRRKVQLANKEITDEEYAGYLGEQDKPLVDLVDKGIDLAIKFKAGGALAKGLTTNPLAQKVLSKTLAIPVVGPALTSAISGSIGFTGFTAATDLPELINQEITGEEYLDNLYSSAKMGAVVGGTIGIVTGTLGAIQEAKATKIAKAFQDAPIRTPMPDLKLTNAQAEKLLYEPSSMGAKGHVLKNQMMMRQLAQKPLDQEDVKLLNKILIGKDTIALNAKDSIEANRLLEYMIGNGRFHPGMLRVEGGAKKLAKEISKVKNSSIYRDASKEVINDYLSGWVPGYAKAERYGFGEITKGVDRAQVKTAERVIGSSKIHDKLYSSIEKTYPESSKKIIQALEPSWWDMTAKDQQNLIASMTTQEKHVLRQYNKMLKFWKGRMQKEGLQTINKDYFPHIRDGLKQAIRENPYVGPTGKGQGLKRAGYEKARTILEPGKGEYSLDVDRVMRDYEANMIRAYEQRQAQKLVKSFLKTHNMNGKDYVAKQNAEYLTKAMNENLRGATERELQLDESWKIAVEKFPEQTKKVLKSFGLTARHPGRKLSSLVVQGISRAKLGSGNWKFAIRNFTTQRHYASMFTDYTSGNIAEKILLDPKKAQQILQHSQGFKTYTRLSGPSAMLGLEEEALRLSQTSLARRMGVGYSKKIKNAAQVIGDMGYAPVKKSAINNFAKSYIQGYVHAKRMGLGELPARLAGDSVAQTTQYIYTYTNKLDNFRGPMGRMAGLFGSWSPNHFQMLRKAMGSQPFYKWAMNVGLTSVVAETMGKSDKYFNSASIRNIYESAPLYTELITEPIKTYEGLMRGASTGDFKPFLRSAGLIAGMFRPSKDTWAEQVLKYGAPDIHDKIYGGK